VISESGGELYSAPKPIDTFTTASTATWLVNVKVGLPLF
jgi:hypothetical protein